MGRHQVLHRGKLGWLEVESVSPAGVAGTFFRARDHARKGGVRLAVSTSQLERMRLAAARHGRAAA